jgi:hypothetical protein
VNFLPKEGGDNKMLNKERSNYILIIIFNNNLNRNAYDEESFLSSVSVTDEDEFFGNGLCGY